jgi:hypothetical protein
MPDPDELAARDARIRAGGPPPVSQPPRTELSPATDPFSFGVIREKTAGARYMIVTFVKPAATYATDGAMEPIDGWLAREVLCEVGLTADDYPDAWMWEGDIGDWDPSDCRARRIYRYRGSYMMEHDRRQYVTDTGEHEPTDCTVQGGG